MHLNKLFILVLMVLALFGSCASSAQPTYRTSNLNQMNANYTENVVGVRIAKAEDSSLIATRADTALGALAENQLDGRLLGNTTAFKSYNTLNSEEILEIDMQANEF